MVAYVDMVDNFLSTKGSIFFVCFLTGPVVSYFRLHVYQFSSVFQNKEIFQMVRSLVFLAAFTIIQDIISH